MKRPFIKCTQCGKKMKEKKYGVNKFCSTKCYLQSNLHKKNMLKLSKRMKLYGPNKKITASDKEEYNNKYFSYIFAYWLADGSKSFCKTKSQYNLIFAVKDITEAQSLYKIIKKIKPDIGNMNFKQKNYTVLFSKGQPIEQKLKQELENPQICFKYPWEFLAGFIDSDGSIDLPYINKKFKGKNVESKAVRINFYNTNNKFLNLIKKVLYQLNIPFSFMEETWQKNDKIWNIKHMKKSYRIMITNRYYLYLLLKKTLYILYKKERATQYIQNFEKIYLNMKIPVIEKFVGVQGEQTTQGLIEYFVRIACCNMRCSICDTKISWITKGTALKKYGYTIQQILNDIKKSKCSSVCLTGGEITCFRNAVTALTIFLKLNNYHIVIQTNGKKFCNTMFSLADQVAMDMKTPCTGEKSNISFIRKLRPEKDCIKTLILNQKDLNYAQQIQKKAQKYKITQILQPCNDVGKDSTQDLIIKLKWIIEQTTKNPEKWTYVRILPQQHVLIYGNKRCV